jgi:hypothetical protein
MKRNFIIFLTFLTIIFSCKFKEDQFVDISKPKEKKQVKKKYTKNILQNQSKQFFKDSLLNDKFGIIDNYFKIYKTDTCADNNLKISELKAEFEGIRNIKGITKNKTKDTVFVMPRFNECEAGTYCFFDKNLPRLKTDSYCCHPDDLFVIDDLDEDGIREIGIFYSSCSGRDKSLIIYSLKQNNWKEIGTSDFDVLTQDPTKVKFENLVIKINKNKFKICNFIDGEKKWETINIK